MKLLTLMLLLATAAHAQHANDLAQEAANLVNQGSYSAAITKYQAAIGLEPDNASFHLSLGLVYQATKDYDRAIEEIARAIELDPKSLQAHYSHALLHEAKAFAARDQGDSERQKRHLRIARKAWERYIRRETDPEKLKTAKKHLDSIVAQL
ncbi:MAG: tetratricopeptide repeat protein [Elusimicrobiota bacterium]